MLWSCRINGAFFTSTSTQTTRRLIPANQQQMPQSSHSQAATQLSSFTGFFLVFTWKSFPVLSRFITNSSFQVYKSHFLYSVLLKDFGRYHLFHTTRMMTYPPARRNGHSEQRTSPRTDDIARTIVDSSKTPFSYPRLTADSTSGTSIILLQHVRISDRLLIPGHSATLTTCPEHQDLLSDSDISANYSKIRNTLSFLSLSFLLLLYNIPF